MEELHKDHPGASRMKAVARSYFWYPGLDRDIEKKAHSCVACQAVKNAPPAAPLHPWLWPTKPWQRIHVDFAGPINGKSYLLVVDAHSKWPEIIEMNSTTAQRTIAELRKMFAAHGLPQQLVSDNGPQFISDEFATFMKMNGVKHIRCAPYHPASNGAVERLVQTFKKAIKAASDTNFALASFLLSYRATPHSTTNETPCKLFLGRQLRTRLDLLLSNCEETVSKRQADQKIAHDKHCKPREFTVGENVMARNNKQGLPYVPAVVKKKLGPLTYLIQTQDGLIWKRHIEHLKGLGHDVTVTPLGETTDEEIIYPTWVHSNSSSVPDSVDQQQHPVTEQPTRRYPQRESRHPPSRYIQESDND